jgi:hypothetical protein
MNIIIDILVGGMAGTLAFVVLCCCKAGGDSDKYGGNGNDD